MTNGKIILRNWRAGSVGIPRRRAMLLLAIVLFAGTVFDAVSKEALNRIDTAETVLRPGDYVYVDSGNAIDGGYVIRVDPATGERMVISVGGLLNMPFDVVVTPQGQIIVSDSGRLIRIDPETKRQTVIANSSRCSLGCVYGIALGRDGKVYGANTQAIIEVDLATGQTRVVSCGGYLRCPLGVAVARNSDLIILNRGWPNQIIRVNPHNGHQRVISEGGYLKSPQCIAVTGDDAYVTDVATPDGNFGVGQVIRVDLKTGAQTVVAQGEYLICPVGIAVDSQGQLIVGDPYTINPKSPDWYDGGIIKIDPQNGMQTLKACGQGGCCNPRGVAVVPNLKKGHVHGNVD